MAEEKKKRRKRKDSTCALKPPLDFIESPLNGQKYYCTPVQAARRPFLAASLPVDDEVSMKWVRNIRGFCPRVPVHKNRYKRPNNVQQLNKGS